MLILISFQRKTRYRFYTEGTIEEHLQKEHSKALENLSMPEEQVEVKFLMKNMSR